MKAHGDVSQGGIFRFGKPGWIHRPYRDREPYFYSAQQCSYCGSIHPLDLEKLIAPGGGGTQFHVADMKYGWPHKFYLYAPNEVAGQEVECGYTWGPATYLHPDGQKIPTISVGSETQMLKFYSEHLLDLDAADFDRIANAIWKATNILFLKRPNDGALLYRIGLNVDA